MSASLSSIDDIELGHAQVSTHLVHCVESNSTTSRTPLPARQSGENETKSTYSPPNIASRSEPFSVREKILDYPAASLHVRPPFFPDMGVHKRVEQVKVYDLPKPKGPVWYRSLRWLYFPVYKRLFSVAFVVNLAVIIGLSANHKQNSSSAGAAAAINLMISVLMRNEHVINTLFLLAAATPYSVPMSIRRRIAKVYCYGGLHSGCGVAATCWYITFAGYLTRDAVKDSTFWPAVGMAYTVLSFLMLLIGFAHPNVRSRMHNKFEVVHRFAGWAVVAIYWAQILVLVNDQHRLSALSPPFGQILVNTPAFWCVIIVTFCLFYPWIRLRKRSVYIEKLSEHTARVHFGYANLDRCLGVRLATDPLRESHAFATIPAVSPAQGFSCLVSRAGDWTAALIEEHKTRTQIWVKGAPTYGVLHSALIFRRVVIVATGSGIGPVLSLINGNHGIDCRLLWSTREANMTYGEDIVRAVRQVDPRVMIVDTCKGSRPNMPALTYQLYEESGAEAVFLISNPSTTRKLIFAMEERGVPAFAPIFDS